MNIAWYHDRDELFAFIEAACKGGLFGDHDRDGNLFYALRKPWKYTTEYDHWVALGRPDTYEEACEP